MLKKMDLPIVFKIVVGVIAGLQLASGIACIVVANKYKTAEDDLFDEPILYSDKDKALRYMFDAMFCPFLMSAASVGFAVFPVHPLGLAVILLSTCEMAILSSYVRRLYTIIDERTQEIEDTRNSQMSNMLKMPIGIKAQALLDATHPLLPVAIIGLVVCAITILVIHFVIYKFHSGSGSGGGTMSGTRTFLLSIVIGVCAVFQLGVGIACLPVTIMYTKARDELEEVGWISSTNYPGMVSAKFPDTTNFILDAIFCPFLSCAASVGFVFFSIYPLALSIVLLNVCEIAILSSYLRTANLFIKQCAYKLEQNPMFREQWEALNDSYSAVLPVAIIGFIVCVLTILVIHFVIDKFHSGGGGLMSGSRTS